MPVDDGAQSHQQGAHRLQRQAVGKTLKAQAQVGGGGVSRIAVGLDVQDAQGRRFGVQVPGRIEGGDRLYRAGVADLHPAAGQGKDVLYGRIAQG